MSHDNSTSSFSAFASGSGFGGFPNASNTGPAAGGFTNLTPVTLDGSNFDVSGDPPYPSYCTVNGDGSITIEGFAFTGTAPIQYEPNGTRPLTFRGCSMVISGGQNILLNCTNDSPALVAYSYFAAPDTSSANQVGHCVNLEGAGSTVDHCHMFNWQQAIGFGVENITITNNYVHGSVVNSSSHNECLVIGDNSVNGMVVSGNTLFNEVDQTACVYLAPTVDTDGATISGNLLGGGGYVMYLGEFTSPTVTNVTNLLVEGNQVSVQFFPPAGGFFGLAADYPTFGANGNVWSGNIYFDGPSIGQTIPAPT